MAKGNHCLHDCLKYSKSRGECSLLNEADIGYSPLMYLLKEGPPYAQLEHFNEEAATK